jgi:multiple sugar transport system substrate-binding protein
VFADVSTTVGPSFQWPPFLDRAVTDGTETVGKSLADRAATVTALDQWQTRLTTYARSQGFTVRSS